MEFRYSPVPNASYAHRYLPAELDVGAAEIDKVRNKFAMNLNKNVARLDDIREDVIFSEDYAVFIAQVSNDASMSEAMDFYSPVAKLLESVEWVLRNTPLKIVIKWHPWESKKVFVDSASSKQRALKYFEQLPEFRDRIVHIDHCNLNYLCDNAFAVMTICSQAAVEVALFTGKKTITLMPTYYDFMGISFPVKSVSELDWLNFQNTLSLNQYNSFLERLTWFVQCYLVCKYPSGEKRLVSLLSDLQKSNSLPKKPDQDWKGRLEPKRLERSELAPEAKRIAPALEVLSVEAGKDVFEKRLRSAPSEIEIPEKYVIARYLQNKKWAAPIWSLLAVPLSRLNRVLRK